MYMEEIVSGFGAMLKDEEVPRLVRARPGSVRRRTVYGESETASKDG